MSTKALKPTNAYLEFFRHKFKQYNDNPENKFNQLSVPKAGKIYGAEWKNLNESKQAKWYKLADQINKSRGFSSKAAVKKRAPSNKSAKKPKKQKTTNTPKKTNYEVAEETVIDDISTISKPSSRRNSINSRNSEFL